MLLNVVSCGDAHEDCFRMNSSLKSLKVIGSRFVMLDNVTEGGHRWAWDPRAGGALARGGAALALALRRRAGARTVEHIVRRGLKHMDTAVVLMLVNLLALELQPSDRSGEVLAALHAHLLHAVHVRVV